MADLYWYKPNLSEPWSPASDRDIQTDHIKTDEPFCVRFWSVVINEEFDKKGKTNDLVVRSEAGIVDEDITTRVHAYEEKMQIGKTLGIFKHAPIYVSDGVGSRTNILISIDILEIDKAKKAKGVIRFLKKAFGAVASFVPSLLPFQPIVETGTKKVDDFIIALKSSKTETALKRVLEVTIDDDRNDFDVFLRHGIYAWFNTPVEAEVINKELELDVDERTLKYKKGEAKEGVFKDTSYALLKVDRTRHKVSEFQLESRLSQILEKLESSKDGGLVAGSIDTLTDLVKESLKAKDIRQYLRLKKKSTPTEDQNKRLAELETKEWIKAVMTSAK